MAKQTINTSTPNSGKGDSLFSAFTKINANFTELYDILGLSEVDLDNFATKAYVDNAVSGIVIPTDISQLTDTQGLLADATDGGSSSSVFDEDLTLNGGSASTIYNESLTLNGGGA